MADTELVETVTVHNTGQAVRRMLRILIALTVVLYVALSGLCTFVWITSEASRHALCTLRADLQDRAGQAQQYLDHHPTGVLSDAIRAASDGQQRTIKALGGIRC